MLTVKDVLTDKVTLDIECVDRVYMNEYVKSLQLPGGLIIFIRELLGFPIPSPIVLPPVTKRFRAAVEKFASDQGLTIVDFARNEAKDDTARLHLAKFVQPSGVVLIGKAQEKALGYTARRKDNGTKVWFEYSRHEVRVTYYDFYILDEEFGLFFIKVCTYFPFDVKVCFNGHEWAKQQLRQVCLPVCRASRYQPDLACCRSKSDSCEEDCDVFKISVAQRLSLVYSGCQHRPDCRSVFLACSLIPAKDRCAGIDHYSKDRSKHRSGH